MLILVALSVGLIIMDQRLPFFSKAKLQVTNISYPFQVVVDNSYIGWHWLNEFFAKRKNLINQQHLLELKLAALADRSQQFEALELRNKQLNKLLHAKPDSEKNVLLADILHVVGNPFTDNLIIDHGTQDGVYLGQPVLDADGIVGQVIATTLWQSTVLLLTSKDHLIPVMDAKNGIRALAIGTGKGYLALRDLTSSEGLQVGDLIVSSGLGEKFPRGYPVGVITMIKHGKGRPFALIKIKPSAGVIDKLQPLLLIQGKSQEKSQEKSQ